MRSSKIPQGNSPKLKISTGRSCKENNPDVTQQYFWNNFYCASKGEVFLWKDNDNDVAKKVVYESGIIRLAVDLQVGEVVSSLKGGRLDAGDFIFSQVQMLQLGQFLKETVCFDLVQLVVIQ